MKVFKDWVGRGAEERWNRAEGKLTRFALFLGAIFVAVGVGDFLFVKVDKPWLFFRPGFPIWQQALCFAFAISFAIRLRSTEARIVALAFALSMIPNFWMSIWGPGHTIWLVDDVFQIGTGLILVAVGMRHNGRKAQIAAFLLCVGVLVLKYFAMWNLARVWERYHT